MQGKWNISKYRLQLQWIETHKHEVATNEFNFEEILHFKYDVKFQ